MTSEQPPPMPAIQRVAELFEALGNLERDLTFELLQELGKCSPEELAQLFGNPLRKPAAPTPTAEQAAEGAPAPAKKPGDPHAGWKWDPETGRRIWPPKQSAFEPIERNAERPPSRRTHWST
jgi:hypothetical protein